MIGKYMIRGTYFLSMLALAWCLRLDKQEAKPLTRRLSVNSIRWTRPSSRQSHANSRPTCGSR